MDLRISDLMFAHGCHWPCMQAKPEEKSVKEQISQAGGEEHTCEWRLIFFLTTSAGEKVLSSGEFLAPPTSGGLDFRP
ncbi:MAG: hypothetical protein QOG92_2358 [Verrucomicrobiota bacterium]|jgi:hypothetical protein|nr:hypothetical protein [Verrucomicrobiota bacterium]